MPTKKKSNQEGSLPLKATFVVWTPQSQDRQEMGDLAGDQSTVNAILREAFASGVVCKVSFELVPGVYRATVYKETVKWQYRTTVQIDASSPFHCLVAAAYYLKHKCDYLPGDIKPHWQQLDLF